MLRAVTIHAAPSIITERSPARPVAEQEWAGRFGIGRRSRRDDALDRAHRQAHPPSEAGEMVDGAEMLSARALTRLIAG